MKRHLLALLLGIVASSALGQGATQPPNLRQQFVGRQQTGGSGLPQPSFDANFAQGSIAARGATPTFVRATTATLFDQDGILRTVLSGEARFQGMRRVQNLLTFTEDSTNGVWLTGDAANPIISNSTDIAAPDGTFTATKWVLNSVALNRSFGFNGGIATSALAGRTYTFSFWVYVPSTNSGGTWKSYIFSGGEIPSDWTDLNALPRNQWVRTRYTHTWGAGATNTLFPQFHQNAAETVGDRIYVWRPQLEEVTGQSIQHPGEYNSVSKLSAPYQGANIDGVRYFPYTNGNVVQQNFAAQSETFSDAAWTKTGSSVTLVSTVLPAGLSTAYKWVPGNGVTSSAGRLTQGPSAATPGLYYTYSIYGHAAEQASIVLTTGGAFFEVGGNTAVDCNFNTGAVLTLAGSGTGAMTPLGSGWYRCSIAVQAASGTLSMQVQVGNGLTGDGTSGVYLSGAQIQAGRRAGTYVVTTSAAIDRNVIEESVGVSFGTLNFGYLREFTRGNWLLQNRDLTQAAWTKTTATVALDQTGIDGVPNSASSFLATAINAQVTQATVIALNNKAVSVYLKRITGVGQVLLSGDNFATTTDVTAQINSTTWTRVQLTQSVANPTFGLRLAVSGDKVAFDYSQVEDVAQFASTPMLTTGATFVRNTDMLTYPAAGIANGTEVTMFTEFIRPPNQLFVPVEVSDGTTNNRFGIYRTTANNQLRIYEVSGGGGAAPDTDIGDVTVGNLGKVAARFRVNDYAACLNNGTLIAVGAGTRAVSPTTVLIGGSMNTGNENFSMFGVVRRVSLWNRGNPNAVVKAASR